MGIGTSDGKYYETEMSMTLDNQNIDHMLDPVDPKGTFNDEPTDLANQRQGNVFNRLKDQEKDMEHELGTWNPSESPRPLDAPVHEISDNRSAADSVAHMQNMYIKPIPVEGAGQRMYDKLTGSNGVERYQTWPERFVRGLADSFEKIPSLVSGEAKLPSAVGFPGAADKDDPEANKNLQDLVNVAGFVTLGPGRDLAAREGFLNTKPIPIHTVDRMYTALENHIPQAERGGARHLSTVSYTPSAFEHELEQLVRELSTRSPSSPAARSINDWIRAEGGAAPSFAQKTITFENKDGQKFYVDAFSSGKDIHVGMVGSMTTDGYKTGIQRDFANTMGISGMRAVLRKVQEEFPNAESISGFRVTGARPISGSAKVKLKPLTQE